MHDLVADGNSVILVDHGTQILKEANWIVEIGPEAGAKGGYVIARGTNLAIIKNFAFQIGTFLSDKAETKCRICSAKKNCLQTGTFTCPPCKSTRPSHWKLTFLKDGLLLLPAYPAPARLQ